MGIAIVDGQIASVVRDEADAVVATTVDLADESPATIVATVVDLVSSVPFEVSRIGLVAADPELVNAPPRRVRPRADAARLVCGGLRRCARHGHRTIGPHRSGAERRPQRHRLGRRGQPRRLHRPDGGHPDHDRRPALGRAVTGVAAWQPGSMSRRPYSTPAARQTWPGRSRQSPAANPSATSSSPEAEPTCPVCTRPSNRPWGAGRGRRATTVRDSRGCGGYCARRVSVGVWIVRGGAHRVEFFCGATAAVGNLRRLPGRHSDRW